MASSAFLTFFDKAVGESIEKGHEKWVELLDWSWEVASQTSWTAGGGASVGKPSPGSMHWGHHFDNTSPVILGALCTGKAFPKVELQMTKAIDPAVPAVVYFTMTMEGVFITRVAQSGDQEGNPVQQVEMVFKTVKIDYKPIDPRGQLGIAKVFSWDIPSGTASPSL
jgi:type VI secretion system secreted protein Hcp